MFFHLVFYRRENKSLYISRLSDAVSTFCRLGYKLNYLLVEFRIQVAVKVGEEGVSRWAVCVCDGEGAGRGGGGHRALFLPG